jgi:dihydroorotate dehydrogenase electron transfer subunit
MFQGKAKLISQKQILNGIYLLRIEAPEIASTAMPGQFVMITCDSGSQRLLRRPISISGVDGSRVDFLYAIVGEGTKWLSQRTVGQEIDILGPMGNGFMVLPESRNLLLVAGGLGIAPLRFLARCAIIQNKSVKLLIGAKTSSLVIPKDLLPQDITTCIATEDGTTGIKGMVTGLLPEQTKPADQIFICGPLPMYRAINKNHLACLKGKPVQVSLEVRMGCGLGFCYACTINTHQGLKQVCKDGPVFNLEDVIWEELK